MMIYIYVVNKKKGLMQKTGHIFVDGGGGGGGQKPKFRDFSEKNPTAYSISLSSISRDFH